MKSIKYQCYDCDAIESVKNHMIGKRCSKCNGRLIPIGLSDRFIIKSTLSEFVTIYDENNNEIVEFQSDEIKKLEDSVCKLLDYLDIDYKFEQK